LLLTTAAIAPPAWAAKPIAAQDEAEIVAKQAKDYFDNKQFVLAAELYRKAFRINPRKADYLFGVARSEQRAGRVREACAAFEQVIALLPKSEPLYVKAQQALADLSREEATPPPPPPPPPPRIIEPKPPPVVVVQPKLEPKPEPKRADPPPIVPPPVVVQEPLPPSMPTRRVLGWSGVAGGSVLAVTAATLAGFATTDQAWLDRHNRTNITKPQIITAQESVNRQWTVAAVTGGVGLAAGAVGAWLLLTDPPPRVVLVPQADGVRVALSF